MGTWWRLYSLFGTGGWQPATAPSRIMPQLNNNSLSLTCSCPSREVCRNVRPFQSVIERLGIQIHCYPHSRLTRLQRAPASGERFLRLANGASGVRLRRFVSLDV